VARSHKAPRFSYYGMASTLEAFAIRRTGGVFCNSAYTRSEVVDIAKKTWRVPNSIRPAFFSPVPSDSRRQRTIVVLGSIIHYKQSLRILEMWAQISDQHPDVKLVFIGASGGDGYSHDFLQRLAPLKAKGRADHIEWLEGAALVEFLDTARGMIHFPTEEAFGLAVAEGLARNLKLFAARTGGVPDVAEGCESAEFFEADDWTGLGNAIGRWIHDGLPLAESSNGIVEKFAPISVARKHIEIYQSFLNK
jgi:glycosyltransferase involved in cell wall biosynthesis